MAEAGSDWTDSEIDLIVADYFDMRSLELAGRPFVKAQRNAALQELTGRSRGSIEFKHQNISAVLYRLGMPWIAGYKPMANFQRALVDGVERYIARNLALFENPIPAAPAPGLHEPQQIFFEAPPLADFEAVPPALERIVRKFDPALRDARNRQLGKDGEERSSSPSNPACAPRGVTILPARCAGFRSRMAMAPATTSAPSVRPAASD